MKSVVRIVVVALLVAMVLPFAAVNAQDGGSVAAAEVSAVYYVNVTSGSFADQGDGTYLLTLEGVGENITWIATAPSLSVQALSNVNFTSQWASAMALEATAAMDIGNLNVQLTLSSPTYDSATSTQTFVATVGQLVAAGEKEPELPATFDAASLLIAWSPDFQDGLVQGIMAMYEGVRATPEECAAAQQQWNDWLAWYSSIRAQMNADRTTCVNTGDCTAYNTLLAEAQNRWTTQGQPAQTLLNTECK